MTFPTREKVNAIIVTPATRERYKARLRLLRLKRECFLQMIETIRQEDEVERTMILLTDIAQAIAPNESEKKQKSVYECVRNGIQHGYIRSATLLREIENVPMRNRVYVDVRDAHYYAVEMSYTDRRTIAKKKWTLEDMRRWKGKQ